MPDGQPIELLVTRGRTTYAVEATYEGDFVPGTEEPPRPLTEAERAQVTAASRLLADALAGVPVEDELKLNDAIELLHRVSALTEGTPVFRLEDGRKVQGERLSYRAALS
jgi:hypothetical protein